MIETQLAVRVPSSAIESSLCGKRSSSVSSRLEGMKRTGQNDRMV